MSFFISRDKRMRWRPRSGGARPPGIRPNVTGTQSQANPPSRESANSRRSSGPTGPESPAVESIIAGVAMPEEIGRVLREVGNQFGLAPASLIGGVFSVLGAAVGNGAILETSFFPAPVNSSLHCLLFDQEGNAAERSVQALIQPLRDVQDQKLTTLMQAGAKKVHEQIHRVERERESFFGEGFTAP